MTTILITAYAINPYKGSEDGMGWNFALQVARYHKVIAVTRKNNGPHIEQYKKEFPGLHEQYNNIQFVYFDWPYWLRCWKKGALLSLIYFYMWQFTLGIWLLCRRLKVDIVHNLNFHNDWTPSFLWMLGKPMVWGPVGHHPRVPRNFIEPVYGTAEYRKDRILWALKNIFWNCDPFLWITARKATKVLCMNTGPYGKLGLSADQFVLMPSVATEDITCIPAAKPDGFIVLSAGRFVPLKGFDLTIRAFAAFYRQLPAVQQPGARLILAGSGPAQHLLEAIIKEEKIETAVQIIKWVPRNELAALYQRARVFLFPSHEGAGMVVAEAMSYGLPVVCLDNPGPGEFVHPDSQLKVPYGAYNTTCLGLAEKLAALHADAAFYTSEQENALNRFNDHFRWEAKGNQLKKIYENILPVKASKQYLPPLQRFEKN